MVGCTMWSPGAPGLQCAVSAWSCRQGGYASSPRTLRSLTAAQKRVVINWTHFTFTTCDGVDFFRIARCPFWLDTDEGTRIMELHQRLRSFADEASLRGEFERRSCVMSLLSSFIARAVVGGGFAGRAYERLRPVLERIERDPSRGVELDELAHAAGMAPSSFSRLFKKCMGVGPVRYALGRRIQFARRLLRQTDRKLEDIASELGFTDAFHLSKTFKLLTGTSPSDYRRQAAAPIP